MKNQLKFWGTRGSCSVSGPEYQHFGGNTCCLEVQYEGAQLIIDAGTGIRPLGETFLKKNGGKIDLFLGHTHWDHLIGFPFFAPIYHKEFEITIWAPKGPSRSCQELFDDLLSDEFFPVHLDQVQAKLEFRTIQENTPVHFGPIKIEFCTTHHPGVTFCFKIITPCQTISYVTDNEIHLHKQKRFVEFHKGADLFIHEAQYSQEEYVKKTGWGHSSLDQAIALINEVRPKKWLVTHHDPKHSDSDLKKLEKLALSSSLPCPVEWIGDGHTINLL